MTTNIVIVNEDMRIANAIEIMLKKAISRVLIADNDNNLLGIVTRTDIENRNIYTIEGNTSNKCAERMYSFDDVQVMGYGSPKYE